MTIEKSLRSQKKKKKNSESKEFKLSRLDQIKKLLYLKGYSHDQLVSPPNCPLKKFLT